MKIWISKDYLDDKGCSVHIQKPTRDSDGVYESLNGYQLCSLGQRAMKRILSLDDWPRMGEVMEYDTETEQGIIEAYEIPEKETVQEVLPSYSWWPY